jgi:hypothetical protein
MYTFGDTGDQSQGLCLCLGGLELLILLHPSL